MLSTTAGLSVAHWFNLSCVTKRAFYWFAISLGLTQENYEKILDGSKCLNLLVMTGSELTHVNVLRSFACESNSLRSSITTHNIWITFETEKKSHTRTFYFTEVENLVLQVKKLLNTQTWHYLTPVRPFTLHKTVQIIFKGALRLTDDYLV